MNTPALSICIMTYNRAKTLRETLESILPQVCEHPEVEVVISDNASTDNTAVVCREFQSRFPVIRYLPNPENLNVDGNILACVEKARGRYVSFFSDDDISPPGTFKGILERLDRVAPSILYINHTPFLHDNPKHLMKPMTPVTERRFSDGKEFFISAGLGFLSSLTVRTEEARRFTGKVRKGRYTAHLDIASRIALAGKGPFLYAGNLSVLARYEYRGAYDILVHGPMNETKLYLELKDEGLLSREDLQHLIRRFVRHNLPRCVANNRRKKQGVVTTSELITLYGSDPLFYLYVYPLLLVPLPIMRVLSTQLLSVLHWFRRIRYGR
ncbi:MAG: glycosyltransferase family 2 protein [bacterium]